MAQPEIVFIERFIRNKQQKHICRLFKKEQKSSLKFIVVLLAAILRLYKCVLYLLLVFLGKKPRRSTSEPGSSASRRCPSPSENGKKTDLTPKKLLSSLPSKTINLAKSTEFKATTVILC